MKAKKCTAIIITDFLPSVGRSSTRSHMKFTNVQRFLTNFFVEFLVELEVTSTGCVALRCVAFVACFVLCCVVM